jgi:hypothetical protein
MLNREIRKRTIEWSMSTSCNSAMNTHHRPVNMGEKIVERLPLTTCPISKGTGAAMTNENVCFLKQCFSYTSFFRKKTQQPHRCPWASAY